MLCNLHNNFVQYSHYIIFTILLLFFFGMENIINAFGRGLWSAHANNVEMPYMAIFPWDLH